jgi:hypothetical protein
MLDQIFVGDASDHEDVFEQGRRQLAERGGGTAHNIGPGAAGSLRGPSRYYLRAERRALRGRRADSSMAIHTKAHGGQYAKPGGVIGRG